MPDAVDEDALACSHQALIYSSDEELLAVAVPFVERGMAGGDPVLVITTPANIALLRRHLPEAEDRVDFEEVDEWYGTAPWRTLARFDEYVSEHERQGRRPRVLGEAIWHRHAPVARRAWHRYEAVVNQAFAGRDVDLLCTHDARLLEEDVLTLARATHPVLATSGESTPNPDYLGPAAFCAATDAEPLPTPDAAVTTLDFGRADQASARAFTSQHARRAGLSEERTADLVLAVHEATVNAIQHGGGEGQLRVWHDPESLVVEVADRGPGPADPLAGQLPPHRVTTRGRGLWLAHQLCDYVASYRQSGWVVRLYTARQ